MSTNRPNVFVGLDKVDPLGNNQPANVTKLWRQNNSNPNWLAKSCMSIASTKSPKGWVSWKRSMDPGRFDWRLACLQEKSFQSLFESQTDKQSIYCATENDLVNVVLRYRMCASGLVVLSLIERGFTRHFFP